MLLNYSPYKLIVQNSRLQLLGKLIFFSELDFFHFCVCVFMLRILSWTIKEKHCYHKAAVQQELTDVTWQACTL